jgi:hypothetical protein
MVPPSSHGRTRLLPQPLLAVRTTRPTRDRGKFADCRRHRHRRVASAVDGLRPLRHVRRHRLHPHTLRGQVDLVGDRGSWVSCRSASTADAFYGEVKAVDAVMRKIDDTARRCEDLLPVLGELELVLDHQQFHTWIPRASPARRQDELVIVGRPRTYPLRCVSGRPAIANPHLRAGGHRSYVRFGHTGAPLAVTLRSRQPRFTPGEAP